MDGTLGTTNLFLGIIAAVSVLQALLVLAVGAALFVVFRRTTQLIQVVEERHVIPTMTRLNLILDDVQQVTTKVKDETERVDYAIRSTMHRVDDTADRVRTNVREKTSRLIGFVRGARVVLETLLASRAA